VGIIGVGGGNSVLAADTVAAAGLEVETCDENCHKPPTEKSEAAHRGPDDNLLLMAKGQDREVLKPVPFNHFTHAASKGYKVACDSCHHTGDTVPCGDCHEAIATRTDEGGVVPKVKRAFHRQCKGCHENLKKNQPDTIAPTDCDDCHTDRSLKRLSGALSLERAFHLSCVTCHQKVQLAKPKTKAPASVRPA